MDSSTYHPRRGNGKLFDIWGRKLGSSGLSWLTGQGRQAQHIIWPAHQDPPLMFVRNLRNKLDRRGYDGAGFRTIQQQVHFRPIPEWTQSDARLSEFVLHRFPHIFSKSEKLRRKSRRRAAHFVYVLYLWYRCLASLEEIATETRTSQSHVRSVINRATEHGDLYFRGNICCRFRQLPVAAD